MFLYDCLSASESVITSEMSEFSKKASNCTSLAGLPVIEKLNNGFASLYYIVLIMTVKKPKSSLSVTA